MQPTDQVDFTDRLMGRIIRGLESGDQLRATAGGIREISSEEWATQVVHRRPRVSQARLSVLRDVCPEDAVQLFSLASMSASGYVRQEALVELAALCSMDSLRAVLPRLTDHVPQVAEEAGRTYRCLLHLPELADCLVANYRLVLAVEQSSRGVPEDLGELVWAPLRQSRAALVRGFESTDRRERNFCLRLILQLETLDDALLERVATHFEPGVRHRFARAVAGGELQVSDAILDRLLRDRFGAVAALAIASLSPQERAARVSTLLACTTNRSAAVRMQSRLACRAQGIENFAERAREQLDAGAREPGVLLAMGETGTSSDFDRVAVGAALKGARVRVAAYQAKRRPDPERTMREFSAGWRDSNGGVRSVIVGIASALDSNLWVSTARETLASLGQSDSVRRSAFSALSSLPAWDGLVEILQGLQAQPQLLRNEVGSRINLWMARYGGKLFSKPDAATMQQLAALWGDVHDSPHMPPSAMSAWRSLSGWIENLLVQPR